MAMTDAERREALAKLGLGADGPALTVAPQPDVPARAAEPVVVAEPGGMPDDEAITTVLVAHGVTGEVAYRAAFDTFKASAKTHGRAASSPLNKALSARIQTLQARARREAGEVRKEAKADTTGYVREKARESQTQKAAEAALEAVLALLKQRGIDLTQEGEA